MRRCHFSRRSLCLCDGSRLPWRQSRPWWFCWSLPFGCLGGAGVEFQNELIACVHNRLWRRWYRRSKISCKVGRVGEIRGLLFDLSFDFLFVLHRRGRTPYFESRGARDSGCSLSWCRYHRAGHHRRRYHRTIHTGSVHEPIHASKRRSNTRTVHMLNVMETAIVHTTGATHTGGNRAGSWRRMNTERAILRFT